MSISGVRRLPEPVEDSGEARQSAGYATDVEKAAAACRE